VKKPCILKAKAAFKLAENSVAELQEERFIEANTALNDLEEIYPESEYLPELRKLTKQIIPKHMDYKKMPADKTTRTHDTNKIDAPTENIYEALTIIAKACGADQR